MMVDEKAEMGSDRVVCVCPKSLPRKYSGGLERKVAGQEMRTAGEVEVIS